MEISRKWRFSCLLLGLFFLATTLQGVQGEVELGPSESECRPYIEKALKELETADTEPVDPGTPTTEDTENVPVLEGTIDDSEHHTSAGEDDTDKGDTESTEAQQEGHKTSTETQEQDDDQSNEDKKEKSEEEAKKEPSDETVAEETNEEEQKQESVEQNDQAAESQEAQAETQETQVQSQETQAESQEVQADSKEVASESQEAQAESSEDTQGDALESQEAPAESQEVQTESQEAPAESQEAAAESQEATQEEPSETQEAPPSTEAEEVAESVESADEKHKSDGESVEAEPTESTEKTDDAASVEKIEELAAASTETAESIEKVDEETEAEETKVPSAEETESVEEPQADEPASEAQEEEVDETETDAQTEEVEDESDKSGESKEKELKEAVNEVEEPIKGAEVIEEESKEREEVKESETVKQSEEEKQEEIAAQVAEGEEKQEEATKETKEEVATKETELEEESQTEEETIEPVPEEDLILEIEIPENIRPRDQVDQLLKLDDDNTETEAVLNNVAQVTLKELKRLYENAIKPLETLYKYRDLSNRHFGDSEIFSKPLVLFMGPWSGGKSSIINYLLDNEYNATSLRTGAEPSPAYFNLLMHGDQPEVLDGTQLAADFTFAGLQKFGQGLEERLRGLKLPSKLLEKINIVEIPGILEVRKQVSRVFPFNDACQWFIDRADIIFLVYDPSKLDVGPETEAILDQLKGREHQTRIILNKADQVKPEELMRVQGALIWNISPLMSSAQPPVMYTTSLWSRPYEIWAPVRLLQAQERAFLRDLRSAVDKRIENKISSARRFAVRVRNHAKMVDCYLTTYYNHKSVFGNRKQVSDQIIEHPQDYHIYEGLSTLTNISRYDLPDPDVYRDFFRLNPLYDFQQLSATCTYFRGCPINRLDVAIAYDLPELVGKHKKLVEAALTEIKTES